MKKKIKVVLFVLFALLTVIGLVMRINSGTPYLNCLQWLSDLDYIDGHLYAMKNIKSCANAYFGSITLLTCGIEGLVLTAVCAVLSKEPETKPAGE